MKNMMTHLTIVAAALAAAAGSAAAQTYKATIPVAFRAGGTAMAAGTYEFRVDHSTGIARVQIRNTATEESILLVPSPGSDAPKAWLKAGAPMVSLACGRTCSLNQLWTARQVTTIRFPAPKLPKAEVDRAANEVSFALVKTN